LIPALGLAQPTLIELGNTGQIVNSGTAVVVSVDVACTNDTTSAILNAGVAQRGAGGSGRQEIEDCGSTPQTVQVLVARSTNGRFCAGTARAQAVAFACDSSFACGQLQDSEQIQLVQ
jgi:hypothetical protein